MPHDQIFGEIFQAIKAATSDLNVPDRVVSESTGAALAVIIHHEHVVESSQRKEGIHSCQNLSPATTS